MATFLAAIASIGVLTLLAWLARRALRWPICPICTGVCATWLGLLAARLAGIPVDPAVLAMLMGASVVAGAQWVEARLPDGRSPVLWKSLAIPAGFTAVYAVVAGRWIEAGIAVAAIAALTAVFLRRGAGAADPAVVAGLEERMKKCC